jgi:hypothetical protein
MKPRTEKEATVRTKLHRAEPPPLPVQIEEDRSAPEADLVGTLAQMLLERAKREIKDREERKVKP